MIDFHSHILPGIDDGSKSIEMSLEMLKTSAAYGAELVVATPHCYLSVCDVRDFLNTRSDAYNALFSAMQSEKSVMPKIICGAEVAYVHHIAKVKGIEKLCIDGTSYLLLELPYGSWDNEVFEDIYSLTRLGIRPVLAHLDRFMYQKKHFSDLLSLNVLCQINAEALLSSKGRRDVLKLFELDAAHILGSDMHNTSTRPPNLAAGYELIEKKFAPEYAAYLKENSRCIIQNQTPPPPTMLPKLGFIKSFCI